MRIVTEHKNVSLKGTLAVKEATIKSDGGHVMRMLANMYSNPLDAIVREYMTNMLDAYKALKRVREDVPILPAQVTVPSKLSPELIFQDFGIGMDFDTLWDTFTSFGDSTKNDSDDETGAFGLGAKSAFAYNSGTPWLIESVKEGMKHILMAFVNERNTPSYAHVSSEPSVEHSGITIKIPILAKDYEQVYESVRNYAKYFPMPLTVKGVTVEPLSYRYAGADKTWGVHSTDETELRVIMGGVPYTFVDNGYDLPFRNFMIENGIDLYVPIGSVDIVPSRDDLMYTDKTTETVHELAKKMVAEFVSQFNVTLNDAPTEWDALKLYQSVQEISHLDMVMNGTAMWRGVPLNIALGIERKASELVALDANIQYDRMGITASHNATIVELGTDPTIDRKFQLIPNKKGWVVRNDMIEEKGKVFLKRFLKANLLNLDPYSNRPKKYGHTVGLAIYLKTDLTNAELSAFFGGYPEENILNASDLAKQFPNATRASGNGPKKYAGTVYKYYSYGNRWEAGHAAPVDSGTVIPQYYLPLVQNEDTRRFKYPSAVDVLLSVAHNVGMTDVILYGVKKKDVKKFEKMGWTNFHEHLEQTVLDLARTRHTELAAILEIPTDTVDHQLADTLDTLGLASLGNANVLTYLKAAEGNEIVIKDDMKAVHTYLYDVKLASEDTLNEVAKALGNVAPTGLNDLRDEIYKTYPILRFVVDARRMHTPYAIENHKDMLLDFCKTTV